MDVIIWRDKKIFMNGDDVTDSRREGNRGKKFELVLSELSELRYLLVDMYYVVPWVEFENTGYWTQKRGIQAN